MSLFLSAFLWIYAAAAEAPRPQLCLDLQSFVAIQVTFELRDLEDAIRARLPGHTQPEIRRCESDVQKSSGLWVKVAQVEASQIQLIVTGAGQHVEVSVPVAGLRPREVSRSLALSIVEAIRPATAVHIERDASTTAKDDLAFELQAALVPSPAAVVAVAQPPIEVTSPAAHVDVGVWFQIASGTTALRLAPDVVVGARWGLDHWFIQASAVAGIMPSATAVGMTLRDRHAGPGLDLGLRSPHGWVVAGAQARWRWFDLAVTPSDVARHRWQSRDWGARVALGAPLWQREAMAVELTLELRSWARPRTIRYRDVVLLREPRAEVSAGVGGRWGAL